MESRPQNPEFRINPEDFHQCGSFEYPQHMFWLRNKKIMRNKKNNFLSHTLILGPVYDCTLL